MPPESPQPIPPLEREQQLEQLSLMEELLKEAKAIKETISKSKDQEEKKNLTVKLREILSQCQSIKSKIEGKETKEARDTVEIEKEIESFTLFYKTHSIDIPPNFKEEMLDIWNRNRKEIEKEMKEKDFNTILLIPESLPSPVELEVKMSQGYNESYKGFNLGEVKENTSKSRIVLVHSQELHQNPLLQETLGKTGQTFLDQKESFSLSDYLILQRKIFDQTGKHIDTKHTDGLYYWTWLPGSKVPNPKGGFRVICAYWNPAYGRLFFYASDPGDSYSNLGCRLSRCFF